MLLVLLLLFLEGSAQMDGVIKRRTAQADMMAEGFADCLEFWRHPDAHQPSQTSASEYEETVFCSSSGPCWAWIGQIHLLLQ